MVRLIVAEKPSVARDLARVLQVTGRRDGMYHSPDLWITWCIGHMAALCEPEAYNPAWRSWHAASLPMVPEPFRLRPIGTSATHWQRLSQLLCDKEVDHIVNACDAGREGELIFRFAMELAGSRKPVRRLWLNALTDTAVRRGMADLRPATDYDALAAAARCRAEADWLIGLNATRAMTVRHRPAHGRGSLYTVGRVQTPTLGMIVRREEAIAAFVPETYWQVLCHFDSDKGAYWGTYTAPKPPAGAIQGAEARPEDRLVDKKQAEAVLAAVRAQPGQVKAAHRSEQRELPPFLYDLTALQRRANVRYGMTARATLDAAQGLYERHKAITYPRTDSNRLPQDLAASLPGVLKRLAKSDHADAIAPLLAAPALKLGRRIIDDAGVTDHHAIIPTGRLVEARALSTDERHVLTLVVQRFIAVFYPPARFAQVRIETTVGAHRFISRGRTLLEAGWQAIDPPATAAPTKGPAEPMLPAVAAGDAVRVQEGKLREGQTKPPPRYNEAMLLSAMERAGRELEDEALRGAIKDGGLGTPATRAAIIETLKKRDFVRLEGKTLMPTPQGQQLIAAMPVESLKSAQLTGEWEARLSQMARGEFTRDVFMAQVQAFARDAVARILGQEIDGGSAPTVLTPTPVIEPVKSRRRPKKPAAKPAATSQAAAPRARRAAKGAAKLGAKASTGRPTAPKTSPAAGQADGPLGMACPVCRSPVARTGRVYACAQARNCTFVIFTQVAQRLITPETVLALLTHGETPELTGFINRNGEPFAARLVLSREGRVNFAF